MSFSKRFPADGILRALDFESDKPIKYGASIGQSLQAIRLLAASDEQMLLRLQNALAHSKSFSDLPCGVWTKCNKIYADYFLENWKHSKQPLAFLLYDSPPTLVPGSPVFIHSDKFLRIRARFARAEYVSGHKGTDSPEEIESERERIWAKYRANTLNPPSTAEFKEFWRGQNGVRAFFIFDELEDVGQTLQYKEYGKALQWGYPTGVGYRYLSLSQSWLLARATGGAIALNEDVLRIGIGP